MAAGSKLYRVSAELADVDRRVFESIEFRVARHPSESDDYLLTRMIAYCLEYEVGICFPPGGLSARAVPAIWIRDRRGELTAWIDVGLPDPRRIGKALRLCRRVVVYTFRDPTALVRQLSKLVHPGSTDFALYAIDRHFLAGLVHALVPRTEVSIRRECHRLMIRVAGEWSETRLDIYRPFA